MRAVVLAAGKGTRLADATSQVPKPMIELGGKPVLAHTIEWLRQYGVTDLYLNLHHLPERITEYFGDGTDFGVRIRYSQEATLLGTAGAVRRIADTLWDDTPAGPFWVVYGDNYLTYDLDQIRRFHARHGGPATINVYHRDDVSQSGIVALDDDGRIRQFIEKPRPDQVISHLVNTGLYLLESDVLRYLPAERQLDFGHQVFPEMLAAGEALYAIEGSGSLTPIDTPGLLHQARQAELDSTPPSPAPPPTERL